MANFQKVTYVPNQTKITAENLNDIQDELIRLGSSSTEGGIAGPQGPQGPAGEAGPQGPIGPKGDRGEQGEVGPQGPKGEQGEKGETGEAGAKGATGKPGQDARPLEIRKHEGNLQYRKVTNVSNLIDFKSEVIQTTVNKEDTVTKLVLTNKPVKAIQAQIKTVSVFGIDAEGNPVANLNPSINTAPHGKKFEYFGGFDPTSGPIDLTATTEFEGNMSIQTVIDNAVPAFKDETIVDISQIVLSLYLLDADSTELKKVAVSYVINKATNNEWQPLLSLEDIKGEPGTSADLGDYYTKLETDSKISEEIKKAQLEGTDVDLSDYALTSYVDEKISEVSLTPGPKGERGEQGPAGPKGEQGEQGPTGERGEQGPKGDQGEAGAEGKGWLFGTNVPDGSLGRDGDLYYKHDTCDVYRKNSGNWQISQNIKGSQGEAGADGAQGAKGETGEQGPKGDRGEAGPQGPKGTDGKEVEFQKSVTHIQWKYTTEEDGQWKNLVALSELKGEKGDKGDTGEGGAGKSIKRYALPGMGKDGWVVADGDGVDASKSGTLTTVTCPPGVQIFALQIRYSGTEIGAGGKCQIKHGMGTSYDDFVLPHVQVLNDVEFSRALKTTVGANFNVTPDQIEITGMSTNQNAWVNLRLI